jgi:hypothetical protein
MLHTNNNNNKKPQWTPYCPKTGYIKPVNVILPKSYGRMPTKAN